MSRVRACLLGRGNAGGWRAPILALIPRLSCRRHLQWCPACWMLVPRDDNSARNISDLWEFEALGLPRPAAFVAPPRQPPA